MKSSHMSRRALLQATGLSAGLLPLLNAGKEKRVGGNSNDHGVRDCKRKASK